MRSILISLIRVYRYFLSPWLGAHCRFHPSCSCYAMEAIERHGAARGSLYALKRLCSCHPWHAGGFDPVPELSPEKKADTKHRECLHG